MQVTTTLYVPTREEWRAWLCEHYQTADEIWLVGYLKKTGTPCVAYSDAVEEALCFGWIDSIRKKLDDDRFAQRYTPRRSGSSYSQINKERLKRLIDRQQVMPDVLRTLDKEELEAFEFPVDIMDALRANETAWDNFQRYPGAYQRIRVAFIDASRARPDVFEKRLNYLIKMTERDKQYGYGIEMFY